ncbi:hypothetical protein [Microvirga ossetica]|uniref:hypothetical protein n=1 Tax=Microvirga ossetica TaxID=1882682 RepID=UPI0012FFFE75|nr:hypothetical protein [Microvirga ossetica]
MLVDDEKQHKIKAIQDRLSKQESRATIIMAFLLSLMLILLGVVFFHLLELP